MTQINNYQNFLTAMKGKGKSKADLSMMWKECKPSCIVSKDGKVTKIPISMGVDTKPVVTVSTKPVVTVPVSRHCIVYNQTSVSEDRIKEFCHTLGIINCTLVPITVTQFTDGNANVVSSMSSLSLIRGKTVLVFGAGLTTDVSCLRLTYILHLVVKQGPAYMVIWMPYFPVGQSDRIFERERENIIIARECADLISRACNPIPTSILIMDLHAEQEAGFFNPSIKVINTSFLPLVHSIMSKYKSVKCIFPDEGALKRFEALEGCFKPGQVLFAACSKRRIGTEKKIIFQLPDEWKTKLDGNWFIVDDLLQSGGTMKSCREAINKAIMETNPAADVNYYAICAHVAVYPNARDINIFKGFKTFFATDSTLNGVHKDNKELFQVLPAELCCTNVLQSELGLLSPYLAPQICDTNIPKET